MEEEEIAALIQAVKAGEIEAYEPLVRSYQQQLFRYCYHLLMREEEARDAVQDIFVQAFYKLNSYTHEGLFRAWLYKIAHYHCLNLLRKRKRERALGWLLSRNTAAAELEAGYEQVELALLGTAARQLLRRLKANERALLALRIVEERTYEEIGLLLGVSAATVRKRYERMVKKLQKWNKEREAIRDEEAERARVQKNAVQSTDASRA